MKRLLAPMAASIVALTALAGAAPASRPEPSRGHCGPGETVVYSCRFGARTGSVCAQEHSGPGRIAYRFGALGKAPELAIPSSPGWENIHVGGNRSQGGLNQDHIRFTNGDTHYVVHSGVTGSLNEEPGRRVSGIAVLRGPDAEQIGSLQCRLSTLIQSSDFSDLSRIAPSEWDGAEAGGGPFDAIY